MFIIIVEPFAVIRIGLLQMLEMAFPSSTIRHVACLTELRQSAFVEQPQLIILGIELESAAKVLFDLKAIGAWYDRSSVIIYDGNNNTKKELISKYLKTGASAYIAKKHALEELAECIKYVQQHRLPLKNGSWTPSQAVLLNELDFLIAQYISAGYSNKFIASELNKSGIFIGNRKKIIFTKLRVTNPAELRDRLGLKRPV